MLGESLAEVKIDNSAILLPTPALTSTDVNYGDIIQEEYGIDPAFPHQIHEVKQMWWKDKLKKIWGSKNKTDKVINWINEQVSKSPTEVSIYTPLLAQDIIITPKVKDFFNDLQMRTNVKVVNELNIPRANISETREQLKKDKKKITDVGKEPFIQFDMKYNDVAFENKIRDGTDYISGITTTWADPFKYFKNIATLASLRESNLLRHLSNIDMFYRKAIILPNALLCADTFSVKLGMRSNSPKPIKESINARRVDILTGGYLKPRDLRKEHGEELGHYCPVDIGNPTITDFNMDFNGHIYHAERVHDGHANYELVEQARNKMNAGTLLKHLREKKFGRDVVNSIFRIGQIPL